MFTVNYYLFLILFNFYSNRLFPFQGMRQLRKDLEKIRLLIDCVHRREKAKLKRNKLITRYLETILFPLDYILAPVIEEIIRYYYYYYYYSIKFTVNVNLFQHRRNISQFM